MRPDRGGHKAALLAPGEEPGAGLGVGSTGVRVVDVGGEELDVTPGGRLAEIGDQGRHDDIKGQAQGLQLYLALFFARQVARFICHDHCNGDRPRASGSGDGEIWIVGRANEYELVEAALGT